MVKELKRLGVPVTVACKRLGISRSTYYYRSKDKSEDLKEAIMKIAYKHPSFGFQEDYSRFKTTRIQGKSQKSV